MDKQPPTKCLISAAFAVLTLVAHSACADGLGEAKAGLEALNRGDNTAAVSLFTKAITGGQLARSDKELAYVKRAEAYLAMGAKDKALADAKRALAMDAGDSEAAAVRDKAQGAVGNGPSLDVTMRFVLAKLNGIGRIQFHVYRQDNLYHTNADQTDTNEMEFSNVTSTRGGCQISYHVKASLNGKTYNDSNFGINLRDVQNLVVTSEETNFKNVWANIPVWTVTIDVPTFQLLIKGSKNAAWFDFHDEEMANRVAKALLHAVELCGGGNKDPF